MQTGMNVHRTVKNNMEEKVRKTLYGSESSNTCAYCCYHHYSMTPKQLRKKECLKKNCKFLLKHEHTFWKLREHRKELRKSRKLMVEQRYRMVVEGCDS